MFSSIRVFVAGQVAICCSKGNVAPDTKFDLRTCLQIEYSAANFSQHMQLSYKQAVIVGSYALQTTQLSS